MTPEGIDALMGELSWEAYRVTIDIDTGAEEASEAIPALDAGLVALLHDPTDHTCIERTDLGDAIVARLREIAAGLTDAQRGWVRDVLSREGGALSDNRWKSRVLLELRRKGLVTERSMVGLQRHFVVTPIGRAVAAVIGEVDRG